MKNNKIFLFLSLLLGVSVVINSCKKQSERTSIQALFTSGTWELASVMRYNYVGGTLISQDTLNSTCNTTQFFTFPTNNTCTYTNYHCIDQPKSTGTWSLSSNQLFLQVNIACKDTLPGDSCCTTAHPFAYAAIVNLGQYSMILATGDIGTYYTATQNRTVYFYGFVRE